MNDQPTPCLGRHFTFLSINPVDHEEARSLCLNECLRLEWCKGERAATIAEYGIKSLEGTWAGNLYSGKKERARGACGTRSGYNSHRYRDEKACDLCKAAEAAAAREVKAAKRAALQDQETAA